MPVVIGLLEQYKKDADTEVGIGTVISLAMPYAIFYIIGFTVLLIAWYYSGLPLGPGAPLFL
jgi:aminobenzoyl-glutamate transport protein